MIQAHSTLPLAAALRGSSSAAVQPAPGRPSLAGGARAALVVLGLLLVGGEAIADLRSTLSPFIPAADIDREVVVDADAEPETPQRQGQPAREPEPAPTPVRIKTGEASIRPFSERLLAEFYAARDYQPAWAPEQAQDMRDLARESRFDGFLPSDFHAEAIASIIDTGALDSSDPAVREHAELLLSDALARYVHHFRYGKRNPKEVNRAWTFVDRGDAGQLQADMAAALVGTSGLGAALAARLPNPDFYRNLKTGYRRYLDIVERRGWTEVPSGANLKEGVSDPRVPLVREHLRVLDGYDPGSVTEPERYDEGLAEAVKGFQRRSGLGADGIVGPNTLRALNKPLDERLTAIRANLERMRWLYNDLPDDYLFVDLTAYELYLVRGGEEVWRTKGVIGTTENQTPMFRDEMEYLVFNPTWTVPRSIEKKFNGVPKGYKRVRSGGQYYLVQQPGPRNALGRVKFMFPNGHAIYLHDTPSRHLFSRSQRAYSHGCVRVHEPLTLAQQVLNEPAWSEGEINRVVRRGSTRWVHLDEHLPVLLYYLTAKADDEGRVGFRRDVYNRDKRLIAALDNPADLDGRIVFAEPEPLEVTPSEGPATPSEDEGDSPHVAAADGGEEGISESVTDEASPLQASESLNRVEPAATPPMDPAPGDMEAAVDSDDEAQAPSPAVSSEPLPTSSTRLRELRMSLDAAGRFPGAELVTAPSPVPVRLDLRPQVSGFTVPDSVLEPTGEAGMQPRPMPNGNAAPHFDPAVWRLPAD